MKLIIDKNEAFILNDKKEKIASTTNDNLPFIDFNGFENVCGWFDVEKLAKLEIPYQPYDSTLYQGYRKYELKGFIKGFQKSQELLSDRRFTEEDLKTACIMYAQWLTGGTPSLRVAQNPEERFQQIKQSLSQPKSWKVELEMEYDLESIDSSKQVRKPKLTNNGNVTIIKIL